MAAGRPEGVGSDAEHRRCCPCARLRRRRRTRSAGPRRRSRPRRAGRGGLDRPTVVIDPALHRCRDRDPRRATAGGRRSCRRASSPSARSRVVERPRSAARSNVVGIRCGDRSESIVVLETTGELLEEVADLLIRARGQRSESTQRGVDRSSCRSRARRRGCAAASRCPGPRRADRRRRTSMRARRARGRRRSPPYTIGWPDSRAVQPVGHESTLGANVTLGCMGDRLYFRQLLSGRDFAVGDPLATQMVNFVYAVGDREHGRVRARRPGLRSRRAGRPRRERRHAGHRRARHPLPPRPRRRFDDGPHDRGGRPPARTGQLPDPRPARRGPVGHPHHRPRRSRPRSVTSRAT